MLVDRSSCADEIQNGVEALRESADSDHRHHVASEHVPFSCRDTCVGGRAARHGARLPNAPPRFPPT
jgi:hypothetical protein